MGDGTTGRGRGARMGTSAGDAAAWAAWVGETMQVLAAGEEVVDHHLFLRTGAGVELYVLGAGGRADKDMLAHIMRALVAAREATAAALAAESWVGTFDGPDDLDMARYTSGRVALRDLPPGKRKEMLVVMGQTEDGHLAWRFRRIEGDAAGRRFIPEPGGDGEAAVYDEGEAGRPGAIPQSPYLPLFILPAAAGPGGTVARLALRDASRALLRDLGIPGTGTPVPGPGGRAH